MYDRKTECGWLLLVKRFEFGELVGIDGERLNAVWRWKRDGGELEHWLERYGVTMTQEQIEKAKVANVVARTRKLER